jgi:hypothetical protein
LKITSSCACIAIAQKRKRTVKQILLIIGLVRLRNTSNSIWLGLKLPER